MLRHVKNAKKLKGKRQIEGISLFNDFEFTKNGILARKQSGMGAGILIPIKKWRQPAKFYGKLILSYGEAQINSDMDPAVCVPEKIEIKPKRALGVDKAANVGEDMIMDEKKAASKGAFRRQGLLYLCNNDICEAKYMTEEGLREHIRQEKCVVRTRKRSPTGEFKVRWFSRHGLKESESLRDRGNYFISHQDDLVDIVTPIDIPLIQTNVSESDDRGFAIVQSRPRTTHDEDQIAFVKNLFDIGQKTNQKLKPEKIVQKMQEARLDNGRRQFPPWKVLTVQQVKSLCSRFFAKIKARGNEEEDEDGVIEEEELRPAIEAAQAVTEAVIENQVKADIREKVSDMSETVLDIHPLQVCNNSSSNQMKTYSNSTFVHFTGWWE